MFRYTTLGGSLSHSFEMNVPSIVKSAVDKFGEYVLGGHNDLGITGSIVRDSVRKPPLCLCRRH